jgi:hypothetical protein
MPFRHTLSYSSSYAPPEAQARRTKFDVRLTPTSNIFVFTLRRLPPQQQPWENASESRRIKKAHFRIGLPKPITADICVQVKSI